MLCKRVIFRNNSMNPCNKEGASARLARYGLRLGTALKCSSHVKIRHAKWISVVTAVRC